MANTSMPWVKLYLDLLDDHKIGKLPRSTRLRFIELMLLAGECDCEGYLVNGSGFMETQDIAWRLRDTVENVESDLRALVDAGVVLFDEGFCVTNFAKRQGRSQSDKRAQWRESKKKRRDDPKGIQEDSSRNPTPRGEERREEEKRGEKKTRTFNAPPNGDIGGDESASVAIALTSPQVKMWQEKTGQPLRPQQILDIYATAKDMARLETVLTYWLRRGWGEGNVPGILDLYVNWDVDIRNPANSKGKTTQQDGQLTGAAKAAEQTFARQQAGIAMAHEYIERMEREGNNGNFWTN